MRLKVLALLLSISLSLSAQNQPSVSPNKKGDQSAPQNQAPPRSDDGSSRPDPHFPVGETSSSKDNGVDISPPKDDASSHPYSQAAVGGDEATTGEVEEFHPWDPHRAIKDIEVGDFYLKRKNYRAAKDRYREALIYKPGDAIAQLRLGETLEKLGELDEARQNYESYLKILPEGPLAKEARQGLVRLNKVQSVNK
ncbi:MAG: tetratricopeptide repeat protein [Acidobacteria bacterium]|nr:tetratricopeptide repeat protein [Acidobacteriota bacterium]MBV9483927.1 tetratricopeptide repeat protein [Acidobacteriota bacterium]